MAHRPPCFHRGTTPPEGREPGAAAARRFGIARSKLNRWCRNNPGLALRWDGRWWPDPERLAALAAKRLGGGHAEG
jgi:hypothetical protein